MSDGPPRNLWEKRAAPGYNDAELTYNDPDTYYNGGDDEPPRNLWRQDVNLATLDTWDDITAPISDVWDDADDTWDSFLTEAE